MGKSNLFHIRHITEDKLDVLWKLYDIFGQFSIVQNFMDIYEKCIIEAFL